jgi:hypothetical protein
VSEAVSLAKPVMGVFVVSLLAVDGVLSALGGCLLLPSYIGAVPFPVSGLLSGLLNAALVWAAGQWTESSRVVALPLWAWLLTVAVFSMGGPGDDIILSGRGVMAFSALIVMVLGVAPPAWVLWRRGHSAYGKNGGSGGSGGSGGRKLRTQ